MRSREFKARALAALVLTFAVASANAEHRVALLVSNSNYQDKSLATPGADLAALHAALEKQGVRCRIARDLDEKQLRAAIEGFAATTPTRGTALVYFAGQVLPGSFNGKPGLCMLGLNSRKGRGYGVLNAFEALSTKGGSVVNIVIADGPQTHPWSGELPDDCLFAFNQGATLTRNLRAGGELLAAIKAGGQSVRSTLPEGFTLGKASRAVSPPDRFVFGRKAGDEWVNARGMVFCWCPPGRYVKGSPEGEPGRYPDEIQREVVIADGFWIGKYELTLSQNLRGNRPHRSISANKLDPLTMVNLDDARSMTQRTFTQAEHKANRLPEDWQYSLSTEDQWEYAARAGTKTMWHFGDDVRDLPRYANFADKTWYDTGDIYSNAAHRILSDGVVKLARVGSYQPNAWGIYDMHGNVAEWCMSSATRGGSWASAPPNTRAAFRQVFTSRNEQNFIGYRLVIRKTPPPKPKTPAKKK